MSVDGERTKWRRKIAENFNRLSRAHERYRQTDDMTDGRVTAYSRSLKMNKYGRMTTLIFRAKTASATPSRPISAGPVRQCLRIKLQRLTRGRTALY